MRLTDAVGAVDMKHQSESVGREISTSLSSYFPIVKKEVNKQKRTWDIQILKGQCYAKHYENFDNALSEGKQAPSQKHGFDGMASVSATMMGIAHDGPMSSDFTICDSVGHNITHRDSGYPESTVTPNCDMSLPVSTVDQDKALEEAISEEVAVGSNQLDVTVSTNKQPCAYSVTNKSWSDGPLHSQEPQIKDSALVEQMTENEFAAAPLSATLILTLENMDQIADGDTKTVVKCPGEMAQMEIQKSMPLISSNNREGKRKMSADIEDNIACPKRVRNGMGLRASVTMSRDAIQQMTQNLCMDRLSEPRPGLDADHYEGEEGGTVESGQIVCVEKFYSPQPSWSHGSLEVELMLSDQNCKHVVNEFEKTTMMKEVSSGGYFADRQPAGLPSSLSFFSNLAEKQFREVPIKWLDKADGLDLQMCLNESALTCSSHGLCAKDRIFKPFEALGVEKLTLDNVKGMKNSSLHEKQAGSLRQGATNVKVQRVQQNRLNAFRSMSVPSPYNAKDQKKQTKKMSAGFDLRCKRNSKCFKGSGSVMSKHHIGETKHIWRAEVSSEVDKVGFVDKMARRKVRRCSKNPFFSEKKGRNKNSRMCHQCQRSDKWKVINCQKCQTRRYCVPCIGRWYPSITRKDFGIACPVCRKNCNCKACLRILMPKLTSVKDVSFIML